MHEVLVNRLAKLAQEKRVVRRTVRPDMTIAVGGTLSIKTIKQSVLKIQRTQLSVSGYMHL